MLRLRNHALVTAVLCWLSVWFSGLASAAVAVTATTDPTTLVNAIAAGSSGITIIGTPTITVTANTTFAGTFTSTGSSLGMGSGVVLGTGNVTSIPGNPVGAPNLDSAGTGSNAGTEYDIATLTFQFTPIPGVNRLSLASVFASEEYNEYVNTNFTDNFTMVLTGGAYTNLNVATVPGAGVLTDINTVNNGTNSGNFRDNTVATPPINDIRFDGATRVFINAFDVVPGTTYTLTIRIADVGDNRFDSAVFVATSTVLNNPPALDLSNAVASTGYSNSYAQNGTGAAIAAADDRVTDEGTTISSATITLTNRQTGDQLIAASLPPGITASAYNPASGVITLSGVATLAQYEAAIRAVNFSNTNPTMAGPDRIISVVVNDGFDNSNVAVATLSIAALTVTKSANIPTVVLGTANTLTDANDQITYTYVVQNTGTLPLTAVAPVDPGPSFNGVAGTGVLGAYSPINASLAAGASQTFTATYTLSAADVLNAAGVTNGVSNTARARGTSGTLLPLSSPSTATTSITSVAAVRIVKSAGIPTVNLGSCTSCTDAGDTITFSYQLTNLGSVALTAVQVTDAGPRFNGIAGANVLGPYAPVSVALPVGVTTTITATYTLSPADVANGVGITNGVTNSATATARDPANRVVNSVASVATATIIAFPQLTVDKTSMLLDSVGGTTGAADLNETVNYTYLISNTGNVPMSGIRVNDLHGTPGVVVPLGPGGITGETLSVPGPYGIGASSNGTLNDGIWNTLAPGATVQFNYSHTVTQAEINQG
jgi:uncharacterized repeat protein (TIGR01451 family)